MITGDVSVVGDVVVEEHYSIGMQDQAFLGLESALAIPDEDGAGVECHVAAQWLHEDLGQLLPVSICPNQRFVSCSVELEGPLAVERPFTPSARVLTRDNHRTPGENALLEKRKLPWARPSTPGRDLDASPCHKRRHSRQNRSRICLRRRCLRIDIIGCTCQCSDPRPGPYRCENADVKGIAVRTNNLPCGAMRGFGVVQACFAHERQMDLLAQACGLDPLEIRPSQRHEYGRSSHYWTSC